MSKFAQGAGDRDRAVTDFGLRSGTRRAKETVRHAGRSRRTGADPFERRCLTDDWASRIAPSTEVVS